MNIKIILDKATNFTLNRLSELIGILLVVTSIILMISLISYSPEDPNFIFNNEAQINNLLGFKGSVVSDVLFQSIGLISILLSVTIFITGINVLRSKHTIILIENLFFSILYCLCCSLFFTFFYSESFWLSINGNGGFIGKFLEKSFIFSIIDINQKFSFYFFIIFIFILFLLSINFNPKKFLLFIKSLKKFIFIKNKNIEKFKEIKTSSSYENNSLTQENFSFSKEKTENIKKKSSIYLQ